MIDQSRVHSQTFRLSFFVIFQKLEFSVFKSIVTSIFTTLSSNVNAWICIALCQWTSLMHLGNLIFKILVLFLLYNYYDICHVLWPCPVWWGLDEAVHESAAVSSQAIVPIHSFAADHTGMAIHADHPAPDAFDSSLQRPVTLHTWLVWHSGNGVGYINKVSNVEPGQYWNWWPFGESTIPVSSRPHRPTQTGNPSVGRCNEYLHGLLSFLSKKQQMLADSCLKPKVSGHC